MTDNKVISVAAGCLETVVRDDWRSLPGRGSEDAMREKDTVTLFTTRKSLCRLKAVFRAVDLTDLL